MTQKQKFLGVQQGVHAPRRGVLAAPRLAKLALTTVLAITGLTAGTEVAASATEWKWPSGWPSPQFRSPGGCIYKIWYGNLGSRSFAKFRAYAGPCGNAEIWVGVKRDGWRFSWEGGPFPRWTSGEDGCGQYFERQATSKPEPSIAVAEQVFLHGDTLEIFSHDQGANPYPFRYRDC